MAELRLEVDTGRLTVDDVIALEEGAIEGMREMRDFVARFVVAADGEPIDVEDSQAFIGGLSLAELEQALDGIGMAYESIKESAVNPTINES